MGCEKVSNIKIFSNPQFGKIRVVEIDGKAWFVGKDVAEVLSYSNPQKAIRDHVDEDDKTVNDSFTVNGTKGILINESGLYSLILSSKLSSAKRFKRWVTSEVLPAINRHGGYLAPQKIEEALLNPDTIIKLATSLKEEREKRVQAERQIEADKPKVQFANAVTETKGCISVGNLAKLIKQNGYDTGRNRLLSWMRENGYLVQKRGATYNAPTQRAVNAGWLRMSSTVIEFRDGTTATSITPLVTGKGQIYFINLFAKMEVGRNGKY